MKRTSLFAAVILSSFIVCNGISVSALNEDKNPKNDVEAHTGYSFVYEFSATYFNSYEDYAKHSYEASANIGLGGIYPMNRYLENYDYIYVPTYLKDNINDIVCVFVTPRYCRVTYQIDGKELDTFHYFFSDGEKSCEDIQPFIDEEKSIQMGKMTYFEKDGCGAVYYGEDSDVSSYCCNYDNSFFEFNSDFDIERMGETPFVKLYIDEHLQEKDGNLYYINNDGTKSYGWKTINGHKYYFRKNTGMAIKNKKADISGCVYVFDDNGICKGKYTGYAMTGNKKVYYKDGIAQKQK